MHRIPKRWAVSLIRPCKARKNFRGITIYRSFCCAKPLKARARQYYTQNDNYFWKFRKVICCKRLRYIWGFRTFSISDITEWPFGDRKNRICYYSPGDISPYGDITVTNVKIDTATSAQVFAEAGIPNLRIPPGKAGSWFYHFTCTAGPDSRTVYRLESIAGQ